MEQIVKCVIVGGPQHGLVCQHLWDRYRLAQPIVTTEDGRACIAAACRRDDAVGKRYLLLHPHATGEQFLTMLAA